LQILGGGVMEQRADGFIFIRAVSLAKMTDLFSRAARANTTPNSRRKTNRKSAIYFRFPVPTFLLF